MFKSASSGQIGSTVVPWLSLKSDSSVVRKTDTPVLCSVSIPSDVSLGASSSSPFVSRPTFGYDEVEALGACVESTHCCFEETGPL